jgi:hypothetical protein
MKKCRISFPIFSGPSTAFATVSGIVELETIPVKGDKLSFLLSPRGGQFPVSEFCGSLNVEGRIFVIGYGDLPIVELEPIFFASDQEAELLARFLEDQFELLVLRS